MDDTIKIMLYFNINNINSNDVEVWFKKMTFFCPREMRCKKYTKGRSKKYDETIFYSKLDDEVKNSSRGNVTIYDNENSITMVKGALSTSIITLSSTLTYRIYEANKKNILGIVNDFIINNYGISAYVCSFEDWFWQENKDVDVYEIKGKSIEGVKIKKSDVFPDDDVVDVEFNPGHSHIINGIWFGSCWMMWYGKEYFKYISKEKLYGFKNCYENKLIDDECLRITLYETPWEYGNPENREKQWDFRRSVGVDEIAHALEMSKCRSDNSDPSIEINQGSFKHGGVRLINYYYDSDKNLVEKSKACEMRIVELDENGELLWSDVEKYNFKD